jgi:phosphotransferase system HPr (HPr) family protein
VAFDGEKVDAASIIDILSLGAACGSRIEVMIENDADAGILNAIANLVETGFGE